MSLASQNKNASSMAGANYTGGRLLNIYYTSKGIFVKENPQKIDRKICGNGQGRISGDGRS